MYVPIVVYVCQLSNIYACQLSHSCAIARLYPQVSQSFMVDGALRSGCLVCVPIVLYMCQLSYICVNCLIYVLYMCQLPYICAIYVSIVLYMCLIYVWRYPQVSSAFMIDEALRSAVVDEGNSLQVD